jgi:hypothetical protein
MLRDTAARSARLVRARPGLARSQERTVKKPKKRNTTGTPEIAGAGPLDWTPLFQAFRDAFEWALDVAAQLAREYPEEVEAVERVRAFMHKRIAGRPAHVPVEDVLFTFGLIIGAIERDLGPVSNVGPWFGCPLHLPSAVEREPRIPFTSRLWFRTAPAHRATA